MNEPLLRPVMPELDSIRGLAILAVLFYHGLYWGLNLPAHWLIVFWCGRLGVNLFFVLSGFLITGLLVDSQHRPDYYVRFYTRRARRILPAYGAILLALLLLRYPPAFLGLSAAYLSNLTPLFGVAIAYPVLWSLAVEEHFYFLWPAVVRHVSREALLAVCLGIIVISPALRFVSFTPRDFQFNDYTWNSADGIACGAALAIAIRFWHRRQTVWRVVILGFGTALALSPFAVTSRESPLGAALQVVPWHAFFTALLGGFLLIGTSRWKRLVAWGPLRFFGRISYGLYLVHLLMFNAYDHLIKWHGLGGLFWRFIFVSTVAVGISWLSREYFEERFLHAPTSKLAKVMPSGSVLSDAPIE